MAKAAVKTTEIKSIKTDLPKDIFDIPMNTNLVHQVITSQSSNRRQVVAHAKNRAEVSGGGIKPWKQKGTGRARQGSITSPLWVGGGVAHGPTKDRNFKKRLPKNIKRKALFMVLSEKQRQGLLVIAENFNVKEPKTKQGKEFLNGLGINSSCLIVLPGLDKNVILATRNLPKIKTIQAKDLNCFDVMTYKYLLTTKDGVEEITKTFLAE